MIKALKHLDPLWYFNIESKSERNIYFVDYRMLSEEDKSLIKYDSSYENLSLADASYQAFKKGIIKTESTAGLEKKYFQNIPVVDHYRFIRKYYHIGWSIYYLLIRVLQLKNPFKEFASFLKTLNVKRVFLYRNVKSHNTDFTFNKEKVTIILPTLNRYNELTNLLQDLSKQNYKPHEIIIIDQSDIKNVKIFQSFSHLPLKVLPQNKKGQWVARNEAIKKSEGEFLLFVDDDSKVNGDWIEQHLKCLMHFNNDISAGISLNENLSRTPDKLIYHWAEEFDSGNAMVRKHVFEKVGLFDNTFNGLRMGDTEFGLRAYLNGFKSISNPKAYRLHVPSKKGGMRDWKSFNAFKPMSFWSLRPNMGTLYFFNQYYSKKYLFSYLIIRIYYSYIPGNCKNIVGKIYALGLFILLSFYWLPKLFFNFKKAENLHPNIPTLYN